MGSQTTTETLLGTAAPPFRLLCWGEFALLDRSGRNRSPRARKARALIAFLASKADTPVPRPLLADLLWSDRGEDQARASLRQCLYELKCFGGGESPLLRVTRADAELNSAALDQCERPALETVEQRLARLTKLIRSGDGLLYSDLTGLSEGFDDWLRSERIRRHSELMEAAVEAAEEGLRDGARKPARELIAQLEMLDPLNEKVARLGLQADAQEGDSAALERRYRRFSTQLKSELDVQPSPETVALREILVAPRPQAAGPERRLFGHWTGQSGLPGRDAARDPDPEQALPPFRGRRIPAGRAAGLFAAALLLSVLFVAGLKVIGFNPGAPETASIAVLPFRSVSPGEDHLAEGVAEEILTRLAAEPELRVAGRTSSWMFKDRSADVRAVGRALGVDYVLEGSVRNERDRIRVNVALVETEAGTLVWSDSYQGPLDEVFAIDREIGNRVLASLQRKLVDPGPPSNALTTSGANYSQYLLARQLIRSREPVKVDLAREILQRMVRADPDFAPAWSGLGKALYLSNSLRGNHGAAQAVAPEALGHIDRALALAPNYADAHLARGIVLEFKGPALAHLERAVALKPSHAEAWYGLAAARLGRLDFEGALAALLRTAELDPFWTRSEAAWELAVAMGRNETALRLQRRIATRHPEPYERVRALARMAGWKGDWSSYVLHHRRAIRLAQGDERLMGEIRMDAGLARLGLLRGSRRPNWDLRVSLVRGVLPSPELSRWDADTLKLFWSGGANVTEPATRLLTNAGRGAELVADYDRRFGSPERLIREHSLKAFIELAPSLAIALREAGRAGQADEVLSLADRVVRNVMARGQVPFTVLESAARIWAVQGRREAAIAALEKAAALGWPNALNFTLAGDWTVPPLEEVPAYRSLRDDPRFERIDAAIQANLAKERRELRSRLRV